MGQWYAVFTKPGQETVAKFNLQRQNYEVYLPQIRECRRRSGHVVQCIEPLFPRYLFVCLDLAVDNTAPIRSTTGVTGMVRFGDRLSPVPDEVIEFLRQSADAETGLHVLEPPGLKKGDPIVILDGPFMGVAGIFEAKRGEDRVLVLMECLGRSTRVALSEDLIARKRA